MTVAVRPEAILVTDGGQSVPVVDRAFLGDHHRYRVRIGDADVTVQTTGRAADDAHLTIDIPPGSARVFHPEEPSDG